MAHDGEVLRDILLVYASQTGNAEAIAEEIAEEMNSKCEVEPTVVCADQIGTKFNLSELNTVIFVFSTTGDGDPPDNATKFFRALKKKGDEKPLSHLKYAILGLGDTNYSEFCGCPKKLDRRLSDLGAEPFYAIGLADDAVGLEMVVEPWKEGLYVLLAKFRQGQPIVSIRQKKAVAVAAQDMTGEQQSNTGEATLNVKKHDPHRPLTPATPTVTASVERRRPLKVVTGDVEIPKTERVTLQNIPRLPAPYLNITTYTTHTPRPTEESASINPPPFTKENPYTAAIESVQTLTSPDALKQTLLVEISLARDGTDSDIHFEPGDAFGVLCQNCPEEVDKVLMLLGVVDVADQVPQFALNEGTTKKGASLPAHLINGYTVRELFANCIDIRALPKKVFLRTLAEYCGNVEDANTLMHLSSREGALLYDSEIRDGWHRLTDILEYFPSLNIPLERLLEILPPLLPRYYSAASSPYWHPKTVRFVFNVVTFEEYDAPFNEGVCTGWLRRHGARLRLDAPQNTKPTIRIFPKPTPHFRLPQDSSFPIIMIGPGTGVAPFVGFLEHRLAQIRQRPTPHDDECGADGYEAELERELAHMQLHQYETNQLNDPRHRQISAQPIQEGQTDNVMWLFFGCRHEGKDYIMRDSIETMLQSGVLTKLCLSFSRDELSQYGVRYVQDNMRLYGVELAELMLRQSAYMFVCGDATNMSKDVDRAMVDILQHEGLDEPAAQALLHQWRDEHRFVKDVWA